MNTHSICLDGVWQLTGFLEAGYRCESPDALSAVPAEPIPAHVPGNVELDLHREGLLEDPYIGTNVLDIAQYEGHEWWYSTTFSTPAEPGRNILRFEGLDLLATVWVNGAVVGEADNMFISHEFDVTNHLKPTGEKNTLHVRLGSVTRAATRFPYEPIQNALPTNAEQLHIRKAPHMFGWDIMPRIVSAGIWRSVYLDIRGNYEISSLYYHPHSISENHAGLHVRWQINVPPEDLPRLSVRMRGTCSDSTFEAESGCRFVAGDLGVSIQSPKLWWPHGYGKPHLYDVEFELLLDGEVVDKCTDRIGLRDIQLERTDITTDDNPGEFIFRVNGEKILIKGSNWVPADAFHSRDAERIPRMLDLMEDIGCNMVRCWGGNVYEDHLFFNLCDENGFLVWQDFAMACGRYPQTDEFAAKLRAEAEHVVTKLRNHASLAVWCGDNECDEGYFFAGLDPNTNRLTRQVLPEVVNRLDPWRPYVPSSPYHSPAMMAKRDIQLMPERHMWGPRDYYKTPFYTQARGHFIGETGYHGCPNRSSLERFLSPEALWPWKNNEEWRIHATDCTPEPGPYAYRIELMAKQIASTFGTVPETLNDFIVASQIVEAEAVKFFIELVRLAKWRKTGILWWNLIDGWPQFSDSVVDYYFSIKLAYHYIRRVQQPFTIMVREPENWYCEVVAGNDSLIERSGIFTVTDAGTGETLLEGDVRIGRNTNCTLGRIPVSHGSQRVFIIRWDVNGEEGGNHYLLGSPPFDLERYRGWLPGIAELPGGFNADAVGE